MSNVRMTEGQAPMARRPALLRILLALVSLASVGTLVWLMRTDPSPTKVYCGPDGRLTGTATHQSHRSYCLRAFTAVTNLRPGTPFDFTFDLVDDRGATLRQFQTVHEKIMHVIVVRQDLAQFQHVHPTYSAAEGRFTVHDLVLPSSAPYRLFADFTPVGAMAGPRWSTARRDGAGRTRGWRPGRVSARTPPGRFRRIHRR
jgi:hypothetical protein